MIAASALRPQPTGFGDDEHMTSPHAVRPAGRRVQRAANDALDDEETLDEKFVDDEAPTRPRDRRCLTPL